jgi:DNA-binding helix-hairpin-helix protein with protein kinase domain
VPANSYKLVNGEHIQIAERLGSGGEGTVYAVQGRPELAVKIYHSQLEEHRRRKIEAMVSQHSCSLSEITAWPQALLQNTQGPIGFLMPRAKAAEEAHMLYSIKSRKQKFPQANYRFLTHVAYNLAKAFAVIHQHGIIVGDVNEKLALVGRDATIRIIDCDSFQFSHRGQTFYCEVGVPTFTPPELQSAASLRGITRTDQHDLFGLAVLIFHLLFLGRHPFAGRYQAPGDMPIETAIKECRFAYSAQPQRTMMQPAPNTPGITTAGNALASFFELAFSAEAARGTAKRPTAVQWVEALKDYASQLGTCKTNAAHSYIASAKACPFCSIELNSRLELFNYVEPEGAPIPAIDVDAIWRTLTNTTPLWLSPSPDIASLTNGLHPSPDAQRALTVNALEHQLKLAEKRAAQAKQQLVTSEEGLKSRETDLNAAYQHVAAFDADGERLLQWNKELASFPIKDRRFVALRWFCILGGFIACAISSTFTQTPLVTVGVFCIFLYLLSATIEKRTEAKKAKTALEKELFVLRLSVDLGVDHRRSLAREAHNKLEDAKAVWLAAQHSNEDAEKQLARLLADFTSQRSLALQLGQQLKAKLDNSLRSFHALLSQGYSLQDRLAELNQTTLFAREKARISIDAIARLENTRSTARRQAHNDAKAEQLSNYLDRFFIARQTWNRIPSSLISSLVSYGIETAADITEADVSNVPGFGPVRTKILLDWRKSKELGFRFDPHRSDHTSQLAAVERRVSTDRRQHEREMARVAEQAAKAAAQASALKDRFEQELKRSASVLAQAVLDCRSAGLQSAQFQMSPTYFPTKPVQQAPPPPPPIAPQPAYQPWTQAPPRSKPKSYKPKSRKKTRRRRRWP